MNPIYLARFNARKNALQRQLYGAQIEFVSAKGRLFKVAFGTSKTEGEPTPYGGVEYHRVGSLQFPITKDFPLSLLMVFTVRTCSDQRLVDTRWKISAIDSGGHESAEKYTCQRVEDGEA